MGTVIHVDFTPKCAHCNGSGETVLVVMPEVSTSRTQEVRSVQCLACLGTGRPTASGDGRYVRRRPSR